MRCGGRSGLGDTSAGAEIVPRYGRSIAGDRVDRLEHRQFRDRSEPRRRKGTLPANVASIVTFQSSTTSALAGVGVDRTIARTAASPIDMPDLAWGVFDPRLPATLGERNDILPGIFLNIAFASLLWKRETAAATGTGRKQA